MVDMSRAFGVEEAISGFREPVKMFFLFFFKYPKPVKMNFVTLQVSDRTV